MSPRPPPSGHAPLGQRTPLHLAALYGHPATCERLLRLGADPDAKDRVCLDAARGHARPTRVPACEHGRTAADYATGHTPAARQEVPGARLRHDHPLDTLPRIEKVAAELRGALVRSLRWGGQGSRLLLTHDV